MIPDAWHQHLSDIRRDLEQARRWRELRQVTATPDPTPGDATPEVQAGEWATVDGRRVANFASNDYLGLSRDPTVRDAVAESARTSGAGAGGSRLVSGTSAAHAALERELAEHRGTESALVFTTGYQANAGVISALADRETVIVSDALNHASLIDGCRLSRATINVYQHADANHADTLVRQAAASGRRVLLVSDTLFSIDGDFAPLPELVDVAARSGALLVVDDAHGFLALGALGRGVPEVQGLDASQFGAVTGTFSKAAGSLGGFVCAAATVTQHTLNHARSFIFSTAGTPQQVAASRVAVAAAMQPHIASLQARLADRVRFFRQALAVNGLEARGHAHIVPVVVGDDGTAVDLSLALLERGHLCPAIRPPTVPAGRAALRLSITANHSEAQLAAVAHDIAERLRSA